MQAVSSRVSSVRCQALFKGGASKATRKVSGTERTGGVGYRKFAGDALWLPNTARPGALRGIDWEGRCVKGSLSTQ
jgi:hypothetical protein